MGGGGGWGEHYIIITCRNQMCQYSVGRDKRAEERQKAKGRQGVSLLCKHVL